MSRIFFILAAFCITSANAEVINIEAKGNLESKNPSGCVDINGLTNKNTPADIFVGITECLGKSNYKNATQLYLAALAYGRYDSKRVEDKTAHQAVSVLRLNHFGGLNKNKIQNLQLALKKTTENLDFICKSMKQLGKPNYHPSYMIQHGMGAFLGNRSKNGLIANFDPSKAWDEVLLNHMKCPS